MRKHLIVGTSGHIDHGKTALIKAITGIDADRWEAEKTRGITIDIGFAHKTLANQTTIGFVDVPGHERFIKNMLAGAMGMDLVLLIVSAEEGFMPQTLEHLMILSHLNVKKGIVVFTKSDLVDDEMLKLVQMEADEVLKGSFLEDAQRVCVSIYQPETIDLLLETIEQTVDDMEPPKPFPASRMPLDRVFTIKGHGTVVTGTLIEGKISVGDALFLYPSQTKTRVKSIQVYGETVEEAFAGQRVALNLAIQKAELKRGDVLTSFGDWEPSHIIDVALTVDQLELSHWQRLRLYHGTKEVLCRVATHNRETLKAGETHSVQLRLEEPLFCKVNDPFVVRNFSPMVTIGGGKIINPLAKKHEWSVFEVGNDAKEEAELALLNHIELLWHPFVNEASLFETLPYDTEMCFKTFEALVKEQMVIALNESQYVSMNWWQTCENIVQNTLIGFHNEWPLKTGIERETLRSKLNQQLYKGKRQKLSASDFQSVLEKMANEGSVVLKDKFVKSPSHVVELSKEATLVKDHLLKEAEKDAVLLLSIKTLLQEASKNKKLNEEVLYHLINEGFLVKINEETVLSKSSYDRAKNQLIHFLSMHPSITVADYRDLLDISRKASVELLEHFDRVNLTKRIENTRILLKQ